MFENSHHYQSSYHLLPYNNIIIQSYYDIIDHIPCYILYPMNYLFYCWKYLFVSLSLTHLFFSSPQPLPSGNHLFVFCTYDSIFVLLCLFIFLFF